MQRQMLRLTLILGVMVTLLGGTGVFAVFSDQATGGVNTVNSNGLAKAADLMIAPATAGGAGVACGQYTDDTATAQFSLQAFGPGFQALRSYVCLRNNGSATLALTSTAFSVRDLDVACTGDEAAAGDSSCGNNGVGELAFVTSIQTRQVNCQTLAATGGLTQTLDRWGTAFFDVGASPLVAGGIACIEFELRYSAAATETQTQIAQSDTVTWNFRFEGTAS